MPRSSALRRWFRSLPLLRPWFADVPRRPAQKKAARRSLSLEPLEDRTLPATFIVNTPHDIIDPNDGLTSLREAALAANASPGRDTINVPAGTYQLSIAGLTEDGAATGDLDLLESVKIVGAGAEDTRIDATGLGDRVLHVLHGDIITAATPFRTAAGGLPATPATLLNALEGVSSSYASGDRIRITGRDAGGTVVNTSLAVGAGTTLGNLIDAISAAVPRSMVRLRDDGLRDVRPRLPGPRGVLSLALADATGNHGALTFPVMKEGALAVTLSGVTISGGEADIGAGLYNQGGTVTVVDAALTGNTATERGAPFANDTSNPETAGLISLTDTSITHNTVVGSGQQILSDVVTLLRNNANDLLGGIDGFFHSLTDTLQAAFAKVDIPVVGDQLAQGLKPIFDGLAAFGADVHGFLGDVLALGDAPGGPN